MSFLNRFKTAVLAFRSAKEPVSQEDLAKYLSGESVWTGVNVDRHTAMGISAVWASVRLLSESLASLPLILYRRTERGRERAINHPLYKLLHTRPNSENTPFVFKETIMGHLTLLGNGYSQKIHSKEGGYVQELWPLNPENMTVSRKGGKLVYEYKKNGTSTPVFLTREQVFHIPGLGFDGIKGYSPLEMEKQALGMSIAAQRYGADFFKNFGQPGGHVEMPNHLKDKDAIERFKTTFGEAYKDWGKKHSVGILEDGATFKPITIPPNHAQFIETRKFEVTDIARIFRVPPHMIADLERATFDNIEEQGLEFIMYSLGSWIRRWEEAANLQILPKQDQEEYYFEFLIDAFLRGDIETRSRAQRTYVEMGVYSPNEIRRMENENERDGGDVYYSPMNWISNEEERPASSSVNAPQPKQEEKQYRAAKTRYRIAKGYEGLFESIGTKLIKREVREMKPAVDKHLKERGIDDFYVWLDKYQSGYKDVIKSNFQPAFRGLAEAVREEIADEIDITPALSPEDEDFIGAYTTIYAQRHLSRSRASVKKTIAKAIDENLPLDEVMAREFDHWIEGRPREIALNESVKGSNAFAKTIYSLAGVMYLRWVAQGPKSCPYCQEMNGSIIGIQNDFALSGDIIEGGDKGLNLQSRVGHPPLHRGCVCQIVAA